MALGSISVIAAIYLLWASVVVAFRRATLSHGFNAYGRVISSGKQRSRMGSSLAGVIATPKATDDDTIVFGGIKFQTPISTALRQLNIYEPTPIQKASLAPLLAGTSCLLHAATGTGKTFAYVLPILKRLYSEPASSELLPMQALIIVPTKELAVQIASDIVSLTGADKSMVHLSISTHRGGFTDVTAPIVIGTAYKVFDNLVASGTMRVLSNLEYLVLDEVDRLIPVLGKYATFQKKHHVQEMHNPTIDIISRIVRAKVVIAKYQFAETDESLDVLKYLQVVGASATVGRSLRRELYRLFQSDAAVQNILPTPDTPAYQRAAAKSVNQYGGQFPVIRPADSVVLSASGSRKNDDSTIDSKLSSNSRLTSRAISIPAGIDHIAVLDGDEAVTLAGKLSKVKSRWCADPQVKRGILFVPNSEDIKEAIGILHFWGVKEAVDLQHELGIFSRNPGVKKRTPPGSGKGNAKNIKRQQLQSQDRAINTAEILERAHLSKVGSISRATVQSVAADEAVESSSSSSSRFDWEQDLLDSEAATDVAAEGRTLYVMSVSGSRGLHLQDIEMVFLLFPPRTMDEYLHAAGRTGRSGNRVDTGAVYTIVTADEMKRLASWESPLGISFKSEVE